jgi:hypothetical protein
MKKSELKTIIKEAITDFKYVDTVPTRMNEEAEVNTDAEFKEYATKVLKKAHGEDFDQSKADDMINGILKKNKGDYGAMIGIVQSSLAENEVRDLVVSILRESKEQNIRETVRSMLKESIKDLGYVNIMPKKMNEKADPLFDLAMEVYDIVDYKDLGNKKKIQSALKKLGKDTSPLSVGTIIRLIKKETKNYTV